MESLKDRLLGKVVILRGGESTAALMMFAYSFLAMMAVCVIGTT